MRPKISAFNGAFFGKGQRPQLTSTFSRISRARWSHSRRELISGKVRSVSRVRGGPDRSSRSGSFCENAEAGSRAVTKHKDEKQRNESALRIIVAAYPQSVPGIKQKKSETRCVCVCDP